MPQHKTNSVMYNTDDCYNLTMKIKKKKKNYQYEGSEQHKHAYTCREHPALCKSVTHGTYKHTLKCTFIYLPEYLLEFKISDLSKITLQFLLENNSEQ